MPSDLLLNVRQIGNYAERTASDGTEGILLQVGGLGGPYQHIKAETLVSTALAGSLLPLQAPSAVVGSVQLPNSGPIEWANGAALRASQAGISLGYAPGPDLLTLAPDGSLRLARGTLSVARDPAGNNEVATLGWVRRNTVHSLNGRTGNVRLSHQDVMDALGLDPCDPFITVSDADKAICSAIQQLLRTYPAVWSFNGRTGDIWLTEDDITWALKDGDNPIFIPTPPPDVDDNEAVTAEWVIEHLNTVLENYATSAWVTQQINQSRASSVLSFNGRNGYVVLTTADITGAGGALIASPDFTGVPQAPTAIPNTATSQIATTAFVQNAIASATVGVSSWNGRQGDVIFTLQDVTDVGGAPLNAPAFTGIPTAPTAAFGVATTQLATTQFVQTALGALAPGGVTSFNTRTGPITFTLTDGTGVGLAPTNAPSFTGIPAAPTATQGTNTTQIATTAFVTTAINAIPPSVGSFNGRTGAVTLSTNDLTAVGGLVNPNTALTGAPTAPTATTGTNTTQIATTAFVTAALAAIDLTGYAPLAGPAFTGVPTAPTADPGTDTQQLATTAFVQDALSSVTAGVTSFNTRSGPVTLLASDLTPFNLAPINNANLTGVPTAPTASTGTNDTQIATTAFVNAAIGNISSGVDTFNGRSGAVTLTAGDLTALSAILNPNAALTGTPTAPTAIAGTNTTQLATTAFVSTAITALNLTGYAPINSPSFTGTPSTTAPAANDSSTRIPTTAWVMNQISQVSAGVTTFNNRSGAVTLLASDITGVGGAMTASPAFSGTPTAPTAAANTNTTQLATTAFVTNALANVNVGVASFNNRTGAVSLTTADVTGAGGLTNPNVSLTGVPVAPTAAANTNTTQIATTAFVQAAITGNYLSLTGGTLSGPGNLTVNGLATFNGATNLSGVQTSLLVPSVNAIQIGSSQTFFIRDLSSGGTVGSSAGWSGARVISWNPNFWDVFDTTSGQRRWVGAPAGATMLMSLAGDGSGLTVNNGAISTQTTVNCGLGYTIGGNSIIDNQGNFNVSRLFSGIGTQGRIWTTALYLLGAGSDAGLYPTTGGDVVQNYNYNFFWQWSGATGRLVYQIASAGFFSIETNANAQITGVFVNGSDARLKEDFSDFSGGMNIIRQLKPKRFTRINSKMKDIGLIAQDVMPHIPEAVHERGDEKQLGLCDETILAVAISALKEMDAELQDMKRRIIQ